MIKSGSIKPDASAYLRAVRDSAVYGQKSKIDNGCLVKRHTLDSRAATLYENLKY